MSSVKTCSTKEGSPSVHKETAGALQVLGVVDAAGEHCFGGISSGGASEVGMGSQVYDTTAPVFHDDISSVSLCS